MLRAQGCTGLHRTLSRGRNLGVFQSWLMLEDAEKCWPRAFPYPRMQLIEQYKAFIMDIGSRSSTQQSSSVPGDFRLHPYQSSP